MTNDIRRRGFVADVTRQTSALSTDAARIVARVARRLVLRQEAFGPLDLAKLGDWRRYRGRPDERVDEALLTIAEEIAAEDREQEEQHERDRDEVVPRPVCSTCKDTHTMTLGDREVMCTRCPTPCEQCRQRDTGYGPGAYCATTPCGCACHKPTPRIGEPGDLLTGKPIAIEDSPKVGDPGVRDPDARCDDYKPGIPAGRCESDGHYLCAGCEHRVPTREVWHEAPKVESSTDPAHRCRAIRVVVDESAEPDELGGGG